MCQVARRIRGGLVGRGFLSSDKTILAAEIAKMALRFLVSNHISKGCKNLFAPNAVFDLSYLREISKFMGS
jgi:hypothetical protein